MESTQVFSGGNLARRLADNMEKVISGKRGILEKAAIACISGGHILLEDVPGTGKTTLAKALARSLDCQFQRIQFTPDLLPADITGGSVFYQKTGEFEFRRGPVFTHVLLADELNRAAPRTQSALLECMEERQVSADGRTYPLEAPFLVLATQNPLETAGTFPLPEAQLDRFFMRLSLGYPDREAEREMLDRFASGSPLEELQPIASREEILKAQEDVRNILVSDAVREYLVELAERSRSHEKIRLGVSPRGVLALLRAAQARAFLMGRDYVLPDDVKEMAVPVLAHRLLCKGGRTQDSTAYAEEAAASLVAETPAPEI